jgi:hypothetical protein
MKRVRSPFGKCWVALAACARCLAQQPGDQLEVGVEIGRVFVPLSVTQSFSKVSLQLPLAGELEVDAHDRSHGARTYCYRHEKRDEGTLLVELLDGGVFGLHTAKVSRIAPGTNAQCPKLETPPVIRLGGARIDLSSRQLPSIAGFTRKLDGAATVLEREWIDGQGTGDRVWHSISVKFENAEAAGRGFKSVTVQNWSERA